MRKPAASPEPLCRRSEAPAAGPEPACRHCERPPCADACVAGAITVDEQTGQVKLDEARCAGCRACQLECPFGAVALVRDDDGREHARKREATPLRATGWRAAVGKVPAAVRRGRVRTVYSLIDLQ